MVIVTSFIGSSTLVEFGPPLFGLYPNGLYPNGLFMIGLSPFGLPMTFGLSPFGLFWTTGTFGLQGHLDYRRLDYYDRRNNNFQTLYSSFSGFLGLLEPFYANIFIYFPKKVVN